MARVLKLGPRNAPKFYVQFDRGRTPDGKRLRCTRLLKGVENLPQARQEAARVEREIAADRDPFPEGIPVVVPGGVAGPLLQQWAGMLKNRNARDDRSRITRHLLPEFEKLRVDEIGLPVVMNWVDRLAASELSPQSQRHLLGLMSRFFSWCIERGLATTNPVRMVPVGKRPVAKLDADPPWLDDETKVQRLFELALHPESDALFDQPLRLIGVRDRRQGEEAHGGHEESEHANRAE